MKPSDSLSQYVNPRDVYADELQSWESLWDDKLSIFDNVNSIVSQSVFLPNKEHAKIATLHMLLPTKWIKIAPVLLSYGMKGSGKSTIAIIANNLHGFGQPFAPSDTFASLRNTLNTRRWIDPSTKTLEKEGCIMCWDNVHVSTFLNDPKVYQMILGGYNKSTSTIAIANNDGTNVLFDVFCPKIISSIEPLHLHPSLNELQRRLIVIPHKPWSHFNQKEREQYNDLDIVIDKIDIDSISWRGFSDKYFQFWDDSLGVLFAKTRSTISKRGNKSVRLPKHFTGERWTISIDMIVTGMLTGCFSNLEDGIKCMSDYWLYADNQIFKNASPLIDHLSQFIFDETDFQRRENEALELAGIATLPLVIQPSKLKQRITTLNADGAIELVPKQEIIVQAMLGLGWKLSEKGWVQI